MKSKIKNILILILMFMIGLGAGITMTIHLIFKRIEAYGLKLLI